MPPTAPLAFPRPEAVHDPALLQAARHSLMHQGVFEVRGERVWLAAGCLASTLLSSLAECGDPSCACCRANDPRARPFFRRGVTSRWLSSGQSSLCYVSLGAGLLLTDCEILCSFV